MGRHGNDGHENVKIAPAPRDIPAYTDETPIEDIIGSPKAIKALKDKGIHKVGDIRSMADVMGLKGVSPGVIAQLGEPPIAKQKPPVKDDEIEEGPHPVILRSRHAGYIIRLLGGDIIPPTPGMPGRPSILQPVAVMFKAGAAELTRETWLIAKHRRDGVKIAEEMAKPATEAPWRGPAIRWLRGKRTYKQGAFIVLE